MHRPLIAALVAVVLAGNVFAEEIVMRAALGLPRVGHGGRVSFHADPIADELARDAFTMPQTGDTIRDVDGAERTWIEVTAADNGWIESAAVRGGYVAWSVQVERERVMMLDASGHRSVFVNGEPRAGDPYGNGWVQVPVRLTAGSNTLLFHVRGSVRATLREPPAETFFSLREPTMPDLIRGEGWAVRGGVVLVNASLEPARGLRIRATGDGLPVHETPVPEIPPLSLRKVPFWFGGAPPPETRSHGMTLQLVRAEGRDEVDHVSGTLRVIDEASLTARVREPHEHQRRTFISEIDGSVQYYAVRPVSPGSPREERPALFLTLHGASVEASRQAAVYDAKDAGHVVAPTNRRPFGFDWEDWGRLDALEVLELNMRRLGADPDRVYLTGHSMGGHGTWQLGVTYPERFAAIGPSAGWRSFWSYSGAPRYGTADPLSRIFRHATSPGDTLALSRNFLQYGVYILHGAQDDNVPVQQARFMFEHLRSFHPDVVYHEEPGAGHWWGDRCCDWDPMFEFFADRRRRDPAGVDSIEFHTANPGVSASSQWLAIMQQIEHLAFSSVEADRDRGANAITIDTANVGRLSIVTDDLDQATPLAITIDGVRLDDVEPPKSGRLWLDRDRDAGAWSVRGEPPSMLEKGPHRYGPFKDAFRHRVQLVYGTRGTPEENAWAFAKARFDAETFWYRGNASVDVIADHAFDTRRETDRNVVVYGNAETNSAWAALLGDGPVAVEAGRVRVGSRVIEGDDLGCVMIRPRPGSDTACVGVVGGTGETGMRLTDRLPYFVSGVGYPDVTVFDPGVLRGGASTNLAGVRLAGYFGADWTLVGGQFAGTDVESGGGLAE